MNARVIRIIIIVVVLAAVYWYRTRPLQNVDTSAETDAPTAVLRDNPLAGASDSAARQTGTSEKPNTVHGYDRFDNARLVDRERNDGDSFFVRLGDREIELRLYFVDAPEKYLSDRHESQRQRVAEQARELGGVSPEQIVEVGKAAKLYVERELEDKTFTVYTYWEQVYDGDRYYGFVELPDGGYLGTRLVANGLARIHTKGPGSKANPVPTPDGASFHEHRDRLFDLERKAKASDRGAWGL